jgi:hypothetical protein
VNPFMQVYDRYKLRWLSAALQWVSASSYAWQGMAYVELHDRGFSCEHAQGLETFGVIKGETRGHALVEGIKGAEAAAMPYRKTSVPSFKAAHLCISCL